MLELQAVHRCAARESRTYAHAPQQEEENVARELRDALAAFSSSSYGALAIFYVSQLSSRYSFCISQTA